MSEVSTERIRMAARNLNHALGLDPQIDEDSDDRGYLMKEVLEASDLVDGDKLDEATWKTMKDLAKEKLDREEKEKAKSQGEAPTEKKMEESEMAKTEAKKTEPKEKKTEPKEKKVKATKEPRKTVNSEIRDLLKAGKTKDDVINEITAGYVAAGKDEAWAAKRAKSKFAHVQKEG